MSDIVVRLPVGDDEDHLFGKYISRFIESRSGEVERVSAHIDAPYLMIRANPGERLRTVIFQEQTAASAFLSGWAHTLRAAEAN